MSAQPNSFDVLELDGVTHYLPHEGFFRRALGGTDNPAALRQIATTLLLSYEHLRVTAGRLGIDDTPDFLLLEEAKVKQLETDPIPDNEALIEQVTPG